MLDHLSIGVTNLDRSIAFYDAVLSPLGYVRVWSDSDAAGYAPPGQDDAFAIKREEADALALPRRLHIAFTARNRTAVRAFHAVALEYAAANDGAPGIHREYGPNYFAAFILDADGYRIEAVCHEPQISLIEVNEDDFAWMLEGRPSPRGLRLPAAGIDRETAAHVRRLVLRLRQQGHTKNWMMVSDDEVVGLCGFKEAPRDGQVEIAYNVWESRQRLGHATRAVAAMLNAAKCDRDIGTVTAQTLVTNEASARVLEINGFERAGTGFDEDGELVLWRIAVT